MANKMSNKTGRIDLKGKECANCRSKFPEDSSLSSDDEEEKLKPPNSKISNFMIDVNDEEFSIEVSDALIEIYRLNWVDEIESLATEQLKNKLILCYNCGVVFAQLCKYYYDFNFLRRANAVITESQQRIEDMLEKLKEREDPSRNRNSVDLTMSSVDEETDVEIINEIDKRKKNKEPKFSSGPGQNPILTNLLEAPVPASIVQNVQGQQKELLTSVKPVPPIPFGISTSVHNASNQISQYNQNTFNNPSSLLKSMNSVGFLAQAPAPITLSQVQMPGASSNDCIISLQQAEHAILTVPTIIQVDSNFVNSNFSVPSISLPSGVQLGPGVLTPVDAAPLIKAARIVPTIPANNLDPLIQDQVELPLRKQLDTKSPNRLPGQLHRNQLGTDDPTQLDGSHSFKCEECTQGFSTRRALSLHRIHDHTSDGVEKCFVSSKNFASQKNLDIHLSSAHKTCDPIGKYVPEAFPMKCVDCTEMCNNFVELHEHRLNSHPVDEPFQCHICRLVLTSAGTYHSHMQLHEIQAVDCEFCSEKFPNNSELERHIIACHRFKRVRIEKAHLQGSNLQPTVSLQPVLNFQSAHKLQEKANIQSNTLKAKIKSLKRIAPKEVATRNSRYSFSVAKQRILFKCVSCSEVFHTAAALGEHRLTLHPHEDTYKCHICGKIVSRANSLNDHVRRHTGLRPYRCKICSNSFKTAGDARQHHFAVHGNNGDKQQANKIMAASNVLGSTLVQDLDDRELEADDNEEDEDETNFVNFPSASLIEVSLSDTGSDSFNMEEVELFD